MPNIFNKGDWDPSMVIDRSGDAPSMDNKDVPSPPQRQNWQYQADKLLGHNAPPWPSDEERRMALVKAGYASMIPPAPARVKKIKRERI
jgi:hypothetical protein